MENGVIEEKPEQRTQDLDPDVEVGIIDITGDTKYKTRWSDLLYVCYPDTHYIIVAFVFLLLAAVAQVYIPRFTGNILDALTNAFADKDDDGGGKSIFEVPGFISNVKKLVLASILCGLFSGIRGSLFTVVCEGKRAAVQVLSISVD